MSSHEGVSCDSCLKGNFSGKRYKCLICYDYDLCASCYEAKVTSTRHSVDHPMQCILTRTDFDLFYGGETVSLEQQLSYTCPLCGRLGFTDVLLQEHVGVEHADASQEVVCPICACFPTGDPNHVVDDLAAHLLLEHRASTELDAQLGSIRAIRRMPHHGRSVTGTRARRGNMQFQTTGAATLPVLSPGGRDRELMDPIAELLSQLSSARSRAAAAQSISSQLHQLEVQLQSSRYGTTRQIQADRLLPSLGETVRSSVTLPACFGRPSGMSQASVESSALSVGIGANASTSSSGASGSATGSSSTHGGRSDFLLARLKEQNLTEAERQAKETERADKSLFVQELLLALWATENDNEPDRTSESSLELPVAQAEVCKPTSLVLPQKEEVATSQEVATTQEVATSQAVNGVVSSDPPSLAVKLTSVECLPVNNGVMFADEKFLSTRNAAKLKAAVGRPSRETATVGKRH